MASHKVFSMKLSGIYDALVAKAVRKNRTKEEVDEIIFWLTGYDAETLDALLAQDVDYGTFLEEAPVFNPNASLIKGSICGVKVETIEDPLMQRVRYHDKLVDELAKGKSMEKILRS